MMQAMDIGLCISSIMYIWSARGECDKCSDISNSGRYDPSLRSSFSAAPPSAALLT